MLLAFALSLAAHEILAGWFPATEPLQPRESIARVTLARIEVRPSPSPTPAPSPAVVASAHAIAPAQTRTVAYAVSGVSSRKEVLRHAGAARPRPIVVSHAKPVWDIPTGAQGAGAGTGADAGSLGTGGTGTGTGTAGKGGGSGSGSEPCGFVTFARVHKTIDPGTGRVWLDVRLSVRFPDGHTESAMLDYPFYYPSEADDPLSERNLDNPGVPMDFQQPPPDKRDAEPPIVQFVMKHTHPEGYTLLRPCPSG